MSHQENVGKLVASLAPKRTPSNLFLNHDEQILQVVSCDAANPVVHFTPFWFISTAWKIITSCCCWLLCWKMGSEVVKNVLVLTNQRIIKFKEGSGSENGDYPKRYCVQQMHLSAIFHTKASYVQSLPSGCEGILALCGCLSLRKYHQMTFSKKYPEIKFSTIATKNKPYFSNLCGGFKELIAYIFENAVIDIDEFMVQLEWVSPNSDIITFEDLAEKTCCCESQVHPDVQTPAVAILDRIDRFMSAFNNAHSVFRKAVNIPQRPGVKYKVFEGDQPSAYTTMKFQTKEGGKGGDRTIGVNPYMLGFAGGETVVDIADVSQKVGCKAWCMCVCSLGCLYIPLIKQVLDSKSVLITTSRRIVKYDIMSPADGRVLDPTAKYVRSVESFFEPYPTRSAKFERTQIEACFGCCVGKSDSEFLFDTRGGKLSFCALNKKQKQANQFQSYFNHLVAYTPVVARVDPAYVASSLAIHNLPPLNPAAEMSNPLIKERFAPLVVEGEVPLAGLQYSSELYTKEKGKCVCCLPTTDYDNSMLVTNRRIMLYNVEKQKAPCCATLFCCLCKEGKTLSTHSITITDAQYIEGAQLFYLGQTFRLCCCGMWCQKPVYDPHYELSRAEVLIDGVDFHQTFYYMGMDTPITNRTFQVISAVSQAARVDKVASENFVEEGLAQRFAQKPATYAAPVHYSGPPAGYPAVPGSMVEVVVANNM